MIGKGRGAMKKEKNRFITTEIYHDGMSACTKILVDVETHVQYMFHNEGSGAGLCVLVDRDGRPLLADDKIIEHEEMVYARAHQPVSNISLNERQEQFEPIRPVKKVQIKEKEKKKSWADKIR